jgi:transcriptional regulator with XRE-family HTH domain
MPEIHENSFACRLRRIRKERGLTQTELAKKIGFRYQIIGAYESGKFEPSLFNIQNLCIALNVTASELLGF